MDTATGGNASASVKQKVDVCRRSCGYADGNCWACSNFVAVCTLMDNLLEFHSDEIYAQVSAPPLIGERSLDSR